jgi:hypothetical protein
MSARKEIQVLRTCVHTAELKIIYTCKLQTWKLIASIICRVGQNFIYTVYIRYCWQGNYQINCRIRCKYVIMANPNYKACRAVGKKRVQHAVRLARLAAACRQEGYSWSVLHLCALNHFQCKFIMQPRNHQRVALCHWKRFPKRWKVEKRQTKFAHSICDPKPGGQCLIAHRCATFTPSCL